MVKLGRSGGKLGGKSKSIKKVEAVRRNVAKTRAPETAKLEAAKKELENLCWL